MQDVFIAQDVLDPTRPVERGGLPRPDLLKMTLLTNERGYVLSRSERQLAVDLETRALARDDVIDAFETSHEPFVEGFARAHGVDLPAVERFFRPLPSLLNPLISRSLYTSLQYATPSERFASFKLDNLVGRIGTELARAAPDTYAGTTSSVVSNKLMLLLWDARYLPNYTAHPLVHATLNVGLGVLSKISLRHDPDEDYFAAIQWGAGLADSIRQLIAAERTASRDRVLECVLPDFRKLAFEEIFWLRERPGWQAFQRFLTELATGQSGADPEAIRRSVEAETMRLVRELRPNPEETLMRGFLGELLAKLFFTLPTGLATTLLTAREAQRKLRRHAAIFWLADAKSRTSGP